MQLLDHLFAECRNQGEALVNKGVITIKDIKKRSLEKLAAVFLMLVYQHMLSLMHSFGLQKLILSG